MKAILQVADTSPLESIVVMLRAAGVDCRLPNAELRNELRRIGCDTVVEIDGLVKGWGYERPFPVSEVRPAAMKEPGTVYVDVKAHRAYSRVVERWPDLAGRVLWYRINGSKPEIVPGKGDEIDPPCPVLTPNQWYGAPEFTSERAYCCWPPFHRFKDYLQPRVESNYVGPVCLVHNLQGWGYGALAEPFRREFGLRIFGVGSPDGLVQHADVVPHLRHAVAMVHLKSSDAPGYAIYECLAAACPLVCTRRLIWRCRMEELLVPGETCLVFDRETHEGLTSEDVESCAKEARAHLSRLSDPAENRRIGEAGRARLLRLMWSADRPSDVASLSDFLRRNFGCG